MLAHSKRVDLLLNTIKMRAEKQLAALRAEELAMFTLLGDGGCLDCSAEQIATLERTIHELDEALGLLGAPS